MEFRFDYGYENECDYKILALKTSYCKLDNVKLKYNFVETPRKFIIAIINLCTWCSTKLYFNLIFTMQTYKELIDIFFSGHNMS